MGGVSSQVLIQCVFCGVPQARKSIPVDRLEHLRSQLSGGPHLELIGQLDEVISKLEPLDSACSSRRSSISSHVRSNDGGMKSDVISHLRLNVCFVFCVFFITQESFNVLDCGIYRVISRRGSQSDEETSSLMNQSMSEEERLKELSFGPEDDQVDAGKKDQ